MYEQERLRVFSFNVMIAIVANIVVSTVLVVASPAHPIDDNKIYWLAVIYIISIFRLIVPFFFNNDTFIKMNVYFIGVILAAIGWASYPYIFQNVLSVKEDMITLIVFAGMAGGGATLLSADLRSSLTFTTITILPYSLFLMADNKIENITLGILGTVFWVAICISSFRCSRFILKAIKNQVKLDNLVNNLGKKVEERTNRILSLQQKDMLTGLNNRKSFIADVEQLMNEEQDNNTFHVVLYLDMQEFQNINDIYGHHFGDYVLSILGARFANISEQHHCVSCRWSSDEFVVFTTLKNESSINHFVNDAINILEVKIKKNNIRLIPQFYIGLYVLQEQDKSVSQSVSNAYLALKEGKRKNTRVCYFDAQIDAKNKRESYLRNAMEKSIDNDDFYLNYQPIIKSKSHNISGFEALVRWRLNDVNVPPDEFIKIAESTGIIIPLGYIILKRAIHMLNHINGINPDIFISINVSVIQFQQDDFIECLDSLIQTYQVNPANIHLELTETVMIENFEKLARMISKIKTKGVHISIDDFGTGYSSIALLKQLQVDFIKIDKLYIDQLGHEVSKDDSIVEAVTKMSHLIGCQVIAEGIEHEWQVSRLNDIQVDFYQGYYFSKPLSEEAALKLILETK